MLVVEASSTTTMTSMHERAEACNELLNDLVCSLQQGLRNREPERLCAFQIDNELELARLLHRQIGRVGPIENLVNLSCQPWPVL